METRLLVILIKCCKVAECFTQGQMVQNEVLKHGARRKKEVERHLSHILLLIKHAEWEPTYETVTC